MARAARLSPSARSEIAKKAAATRWANPASRDSDLGVVEGERLACPHCGGSGWLDPMRIGIGGRIAIMRHKLGLTQTQMAAKLGISRERLATLETRPEHRPRLGVLMRAADVLGVSMDWLLGRGGQP